MNGIRCGLLLLLLSVVPARAQDAAGCRALETDVRARIAADSGEVAVMLIDLETGRRIGINENVSMHAASTMKVPILLELFRQIDDGRFALDDSVIAKNEFRSLADGTPYVLATDRDTVLVARVGKRISLRHLATTMTQMSSNLATNNLIDVVTVDSVQKLMARIGATDMKVVRGVSDNAAFRAGLSNTTTAAALARNLEVLARCEVHSASSCATMISIMEGQRFRSQIPAGLPPGTRVANKTGDITGIRHDGAIVFPSGRKPYVLVVLTRGMRNTAAATKVTVDISRTVWEVLAR